MPTSGPNVYVQIRTLHERLDNNLKLLNRMLNNRDAGFGVAALTESNRVALVEQWPSCNRGLRILTDCLIAIGHDKFWEHRTWHGPGSKAEILRMKDSTAYEWYFKQGLTDPLLTNPIM